MGGARQRFAVMGSGAWLGSAEQRLELYMSCEGKRKNSCRLI